MDGSERWIRLSNGMYTCVDADAFAWVSVERKWNATANRGGGRAYASGKLHGVHAYMHRLICKAPSGVEVDHINGKSLDNRSSNLRLCSRAQNCMNHPGWGNRKNGLPKGVRLSRSGSRYVATITNGRAYRYIGTFSSAIEAKAAYDAEAQKVFGDFARKDS